MLNGCSSVCKTPLTFSFHVQRIALLVIVPRLLQHFVNATFLQSTLWNIRFDEALTDEYD